MRRERGKSSSKSRRCKSRKAVPKRPGSNKRIIADDSALLNFEEESVDDRELDHEVVVDSGILMIPTVNSLIEMALTDSSEETMSTLAVHGTASDSMIVGAELDIPAIEEAFHKHLGIFENAVEGDSFVNTQFTRKWGAVLSEESWSDVEFVELSDLEEEEEDDDDWFVVLDEDHG